MHGLVHTEVIELLLKVLSFLCQGHLDEAGSQKEPAPKVLYSSSSVLLYGLFIHTHSLC